MAPTIPARCARVLLTLTLLGALVSACGPSTEDAEQAVPERSLAEPMAQEVPGAVPPDTSGRGDVDGVGAPRAAVEGNAPTASPATAAPRDEASGETVRTGAVRGVVRDTEGNPVPMANVFIEELRVGAATRGDGSFILNGIPAGTRTLAVTYPGARREVVVDVAPGEVLELEIQFNG